MIEQIHSPDMTEIATHIDFIDIQMTDGYVGLDAPMSLLAKIPDNIYRELVIWNVNCFTIIASYNCWWPPTHMLVQDNKIISGQIANKKFTSVFILQKEPNCCRPITFKVKGIHA